MSDISNRYKVWNKVRPRDLTSEGKMVDLVERAERLAGVSQQPLGIQHKVSNHLTNIYYI